jgi:hypothetical protein
MSLMDINLSKRKLRRSQVKGGGVNLRHCAAECVREF